MTAIADLEIFARVARTGNMSAAGREMSLSPAVVSKRISSLEARIGARLFMRTTRQLTLTDVGEGFFRRVVDILNLTEEAYDFVNRSRSSLKGVLHLACSRTIHRSFLIERLVAFSSRFPEIELDIDLSDGSTDVIGGGYDLALTVGGRDRNESCIVHELAPVELIVCAAESYLGRHGEPREPGELASRTCLGAHEEDAWLLFRGGRAQRVPIFSRYRSLSYEFVRGAMLEGMGLALVPAMDVEEELASGRLRRVLGDWRGDPDLAILVVQASKDYVPAKVTAFVEHLLAGKAPRSAVSGVFADAAE